MMLQPPPPAPDTTIWTIKMYRSSPRILLKDALAVVKGYDWGTNVIDTFDKSTTGKVGAGIVLKVMGDPFLTAPAKKTLVKYFVQNVPTIYNETEMTIFNRILNIILIGTHDKNITAATYAADQLRREDALG